MILHDFFFVYVIQLNQKHSETETLFITNATFSHSWSNTIFCRSWKTDVTWEVKIMFNLLCILVIVPFYALFPSSCSVSLCYFSRNISSEWVFVWQKTIFHCMHFKPHANIFTQDRYLLKTVKIIEKNTKNIQMHVPVWRHRFLIMHDALLHLIFFKNP